MSELLVLTSVMGVFNGNHIDPVSGLLHGHDYEVEAGWFGTTERFETLRDHVAAILATFDHRPLPKWSAEEVAPILMERIGCDQLRLGRPAIGHFVTVRK